MVEKLCSNLAPTNHFHFTFHSSYAPSLITSHHICQPQRGSTCGWPRNLFCFTAEPPLRGSPCLESPFSLILQTPTHSPRQALVSFPLWHCQGPTPDSWQVLFGTRYVLVTASHCLVLRYQAYSHLSPPEVLTLRDHILFTFVRLAPHMGLKIAKQVKNNLNFCALPRVTGEAKWLRESERVGQLWLTGG